MADLCRSCSQGGCTSCMRLDRHETRRKAAMGLIAWLCVWLACVLAMVFS